MGLGVLVVHVVYEWQQGESMSDKEAATEVLGTAEQEAEDQWKKGQVKASSQER